MGQKEKIETKILVIVPARGGSKEIRHKNIILLNGLPLIAHTLLTVAKSTYQLDCIVSTDSLEIEAIARKYGGKVPKLRSAELASDTANIVDVVEDVINFIGSGFSHIMLLQPTAPLRKVEDMDRCIKLALDTNAGSVCSFCKYEGVSPQYLYERRGGGGIVPIMKQYPGQPRQSHQNLLVRNGVIYIVKMESFKKWKKFVTDDCIPYLMPTERSVNIDSPEDLEAAKMILQKI